MSPQRLPRLLLALGSGLALALAFPSHNLPILAWFAVAGLMFASLGEPLRRAWLYGFLHGAVFYTATLPWIYAVMRVHGDVEVAPAGGILALVVATASLFATAFALGVAWVSRRGVERACLAAPFLWVALEFARTHLPAIGFPWNLLGYAAAQNLALAQLATLTGIYGLSLLVAGYNAWLVWAFLASSDRRRRTFIWAIASGLLLLVALLGGRLVPQQTPRYVARLVQTNFPQAPSYPSDWLDQHASELDELEQLSIVAGGHRPSLVVWPEVPAPFSLQDPKFAARAVEIARGSQADFLVGVVEWRPGVAGALLPYNSAALLDPAGERVFLYDKIHLVPFGEYVPLRRWLTFASKLTAEVGDFQSGSEYRVGELTGLGPAGTPVRDRRFSVFICYEVVFPDEVRRFVANGAQLLINLSNDGWFGHSAAPAQHLSMARVRAIENRRWLLRDTNNGYTVAVDPYGRYAARFAPDLRGALDAPFDFRSDLTWYARWGDWLAWLCVVAALASLALAARRVAKPEARRRR